jgi:membrane associated rhomboid family serine protease
MLIPLGTDRPPKRAPIVTEGLIVANMIVYLAGLIGQFAGAFDVAALANFGHFDPQHPRVWQLLTYQFLHDPYSIFHLAFNMLFLWVFGAPVESRLGRVGFLAFYLGAGVAAGLGHAQLSDAPVIGASGSIAGVTGGFLALFPRSRIRIVFFFFLIGLYQIPALWFIGFYFVIDFLRQAWQIVGGGGSQVAYGAHLVGYAYGFLIGFLLLATGVLKHEEFDVFFLFKQARRRAAFRAASRGNAAGLFESASADTAKRLATQARRAKAVPEEQNELRIAITRLLEQHDLPQAVRRYRQLLELDESAVFGERRQLDLASQLYAEEDWTTAARAYELVLKHYPQSPSADEVRLLLGTLYARYLRDYDRARALLDEARRRLRDPEQTKLAERLIAELPA